MHYGNIKKNDIADGIGVRVTLFVSGCRNHCEGCFQPETWNFSYGAEFTDDTLNEILEAMSPIHITGFTVLGGEPFEQENQGTVCKILRAVREKYPEKSLWCYTGYKLDKDLIPGGDKYTEHTDEILSLLDVLVDGKFMIDQKDITLLFRGSRNQRLIDIPASLAAKSVVLWQPPKRTM